MNAVRRAEHTPAAVAFALVAWLWWLPGVPAAAEPTAPPSALALHAVAPGVFVHTGQQQVWSATNAGDVANLGVVVGATCVAVIDSGGSPALGTQLLAALRARSDLPVCYVINTHAHPDHILGNAAFAALDPRPRFVAHSRFTAALAAREPSYRAAVERELRLSLGADEVVYPDITVEETLQLDLGGRTLTLRAWPTAHTDHDLSVHDDAAGVLFLGDLLFAGHLPVVDGRLLGWLAVMDELAELPVRIAVPGHGPVSHAWPAALNLQRRYLSDVRDRIRNALARDLSISEAVAAHADSGTEGWLLADEFHRRNLTAAFAELEWEE